MKNFNTLSNIANAIIDELQGVGAEFYAISFRTESARLQATFNAEIVKYAVTNGYTIEVGENGYIEYSKMIDGINIVIILT